MDLVGLQESMVQSFGDTVGNLEEIWDTIGLKISTRNERRNVICKHITHVFAEILRDEQEAQQRVIHKLERLRTELHTTAEELRVSCPVIEDGLSTLDAIDAYEEAVKQLLKDKQKRQQQLHRLQHQQQELCELLGSEPVEPCVGSVPTDAEILRISQHLQHLEAEKTVRKAQFVSLKKSILCTLVLLEEATQQEVDSTNHDEEEDMCLTHQHLHMLKGKLSDLEFRSSENLIRWQELSDELSMLWEVMNQGPPSPLLHTTHTPSTIGKLQLEVERLRALRLENIGEFVSRLKDQLRELWSGCWLSQDQLLAVPGYSDFPPTETSLDQLQEALGAWRQYERRHGDAWLLMREFERLFIELLRLEQKAKDPGRLFNTRGGALLQEERQRKRVKVELPRIQDRLMSLYASYESRDEEPPMIHGLALPDWLKYKWQRHDTAREQDKNARKDNKTTTRTTNSSSSSSSGGGVVAKPLPNHKTAAAAAAAPQSSSAGAGIKRVACNDQQESVADIKRLKVDHRAQQTKLPVCTSNVNPNKVTQATHLSSTANNVTAFKSPALQFMKKMPSTLPRTLRHATLVRPPTELQPPGVARLKPHDITDYNKFEFQLQSSNERLNSTAMDKENTEH